MTHWRKYDWSVITIQILHKNPAWYSDPEMRAGRLASRLPVKVSEPARRSPVARFIWVPVWPVRPAGGLIAFRVADTRKEMSTSLSSPRSATERIHEFVNAIEKLKNCIIYSLPLPLHTFRHSGISKCIKKPSAFSCVGNSAWPPHICSSVKCSTVLTTCKATRRTTVEQKKDGGFCDIRAAPALETPSGVEPGSLTIRFCTVLTSPLICVQCRTYGLRTMVSWMPFRRPPAASQSVLRWLQRLLCWI